MKELFVSDILKPEEKAYYYAPLIGGPHCGDMVTQYRETPRRFYPRNCISALYEWNEERDGFLYVPGGEGRCTATSKSTGERCRSHCIDDTGLCYSHGGRR